MHAALRKWFLVALSSFNLLASIALLSFTLLSCSRAPMSQLGVDARGVVYVLKYIVGAKNLRLAFARLVSKACHHYHHTPILIINTLFAYKVSALNLNIAHMLIFMGGVLLVAALCNLATSNSSSGREQRPNHEITINLISNSDKSKSARCTLLCGFDEHEPVRRGRVELHRDDVIDVMSFTYLRQERAVFTDTAATS